MLYDLHNLTTSRLRVGLRDQSQSVHNMKVLHIKDGFDKVNYKSHSSSSFQCRHPDPLQTLISQLFFLASTD